jgi:hypothetical protein
MQPIDRAFVEQVRSQIRLATSAFKPRLSHTNFSIPGLRSLGEFPKTVTVLSLAADISRTLYRHNELGYLIDPGGYWLKQNLASVHARPEAVEWVKYNFASIGKLTAENFRDSFGRVLTHLVSTGTHVVVFNMAVVNPGDETYTYQFRRNPPALRRMEFNDILAELAATHGVSVINIDRILKREGIHDQVDFAHFSLDRFVPIAEEFHRVLVDREVL